ncbi:uncharacterized protein E0L32_009258 [Thyridium curvatum]|uniref:Protein phosphatase 4 core regulatory subunit R2 n=1 Tax=Thyridium curvatum TaxID=1093900 RepID=A0A507AHN8_9PEZI|nr:uncharacterized protein E0L32_009258 [Thyridium curvatum]TPX09515.1 hypothetical protein E0L32_009258 [Thyridium curvatum]
MAATEMDADDEILRKLASGAAIDYSIWPIVLADIVARIEKAARNDFPIPRIPQPKQASPLPEPRLLDPLPSSDPIDPSAETSSATAVGNDDSQRSSSQETNKENTNPVSAAAAVQPPTTAAAQPTSSASVPQDPTALPPQVVSLMNDITNTLTTSFPVYPPHTAQRLAELVLAPRQHYRSLPSYLHALDRVVHVTSGSNVFPLPPAVPDMSTMTLMSNGPARDAPWVNGTSSSPASSSASNAPAPINVGSDEALGGALLTPIPWLHRRTASSSVSGGSSSPPEPDPAQLATGQQQSPQQQQTGGAQSQAQGQGQGGGQFEGQVHTETTETIEGPNGMGSIETVSISVNGIPSHGATVQVQRGVTQGELLRQEQRAGVVPVTQLARASMPATAGPIGLGSGAGTGGNNASPSPSPSVAVQAQAGAAGDEDTAMPDEDAADPGPTSSASAAADQDEDDTTEKPAATGEEDSPEQQSHQEIPHARGPEEIGAADMGPQKESSSTFVTSPSGAVEMHGIDVAAAVGRSKADDTYQQQRKSKSKSPEAAAVAAAGGTEDDEDKENDGKAAAAAVTERARRATTPKREAEGGPDDAAEPAAKRLREDESAGAAAGEAGDEGVKKDAEGDTVLTDQDVDGGKEE